MARRTGYRRSKKRRQEFIRDRQEGVPSESQQFLRNLRQIIRHSRRQKKMTQEGLGSLARVNAKYLGEVELGKANPTVLFLLKVAGSLGLEITDLFFGSESPGGENAFMYGEIMGLVRRLDPRNLQKLHKIIKVILD